MALHLWFRTRYAKCSWQRMVYCSACFHMRHLQLSRKMLRRLRATQTADPMPRVLCRHCKKLFALPRVMVPESRQLTRLEVVESLAR